MLFENEDVAKHGSHPNTSELNTGKISPRLKKSRAIVQKTEIKMLFLCIEIECTFSSEKLSTAVHLEMLNNQHIFKE
jgi:hypothetical protein